MSSKIFITGDSWGVKEWTRNNMNDSAEEIERKDHDSHRGLHTYFEQDGFEVHNKSSGGSSNKDSIDRLIEYINDGDNLYNKNVDYIFWIVTDPIRDLRPYNIPENKLADEICASNGLKKLIKKLFHNACDHANRLAKIHDLKIHLIGGITSFDPKEIDPYDNLVALVPSWYHFLLTDQETKLIPKATVWTSQTSDVHIDDINIKYISKNLNKIKSRKVLNEYWHISEFQRVVHNYNAFFKLDNSHPNRDAHRLVYDYIIKYINDGRN
jgi:hypothetical protein